MQQILKKVFSSKTIIMKTAWKKQNGIGKLPAKDSEISDMIHSFQATGYPIVSKLNKCLKFKSIRGIKMTVFYTKNP